MVGAALVGLADGEVEGASVGSEVGAALGISLDSPEHDGACWRALDGSAFPGRDAGTLLELARLCSNPDKKDDPIDRAVIRAFEESNGAGAADRRPTHMAS